MEKVFVSPGHYCQGPGILEKIGEKTKSYGKCCLVIADDFVAGFARGPIEQSLDNSSVQSDFESFSGECSLAEISRLVDKATQANVEVIIAVGGGKTLDTGKAVAHTLHAACIIVPTIASTDAPTSSLVVIYSEDHVHESVLFLPRNPDLVLVDTEIIAAAPARFLVAGMGDAIATKYEAEACFRSGAKNFQGSTCTLTALALADLCHSILIEHGHAANLAARQNILTPSMEKVIEANILLSGLGFENGGETIAHAFSGSMGLITASNSSFHGEKVAVGLLVQLLMEDRPLKEIGELLHFYRTVGLPVNLSGIGWIDPTEDELEKVASRMCREGSIAHNMAIEVTESLVINTLKYMNNINWPFVESVDQENWK